MSSSRSGRILAARPVFFATSAATQANRLPWVSLPPKAPPMRRHSTVTALFGTPSTIATMCWISLGCWVEAVDRDLVVLARDRHARSGPRGRNGPGRRSRSGPASRRGALAIAAAASPRSQRQRIGHQPLRRPRRRDVEHRRQILVLDHARAAPPAAPGRGFAPRPRTAAGRRTRPRVVANTGSSWRCVGLTSLTPGMSSAVSTSTTPGAARTGSRSSCVIRHAPWR